MAIFNRNKTDSKSNPEQLQNAIQVNDVSYGWGGIWNKSMKKYSDFYKWIIFDYIFKGVSNVTFTNNSTNNYVSAICNFIDNNANLLISQYWRKGFICVFYDNNFNFCIPEDDKLRYDKYQRVINRDCVVVYSSKYQLERKTDFDEIQSQLDILDDLTNVLVDSSNTFGVLPILSGSAIPADPKFKEDLNTFISRKFGYGKDKYKLFLSKTDLKVDTIDLKVKDLEITNKIQEAFKYLARYFSVPTDLLIGGSTFDNMSEAKKTFYNDCVRFYAELLLRVARNLLTSSSVYLPQNVISYKIENIPEIEKTLSAACTERSTYLDYLLKLQTAGVDITDLINELANETKNLLKEK